MRFSRFAGLCTAVAGFATLAGAQTPYNQLPSRIIGQAILQRTTLTAVAPNLAEGKEFFNPQSVALDTSASPNILYVADTGNNRILAWKNAASAGNGAIADMVIGQPDFYSTTFQGPSSTTNYGLNQPVAIAVDSKGNLYIVDSGNNRILRFPKPFSQGSGIQPPDLVIGQTSLNSNVANQGQSAPSANTVCLAANGSLYRSGLAFDSQGNLWFSDACNNRVLRYPASGLGSSAANGPAADTVIGQTDFISNKLPNNPTQQMKTFLAQPTFLAFDPSGRLYVADNFLRVLVFQNPLTTGEPAIRILGVVPGATAVSASTLGASQIPPEGIFFVGSNPWVVDTPNSRIVGYAPFEQWAPESQSFSPAATSVLGQADFVSIKVNHGDPQPSNNSFDAPVGAVFNGTTLYVADAGNHRVLAFPVSGTTFTTASVVFGQSDFKYGSVNRIDGREFNFSLGGGGGVAVDTTSNPPHLYVADAGNHRVLAFSDIRKAAAGLSADLVIGQPDLRTAISNFPSGTAPTNTSLSLPTGVAVDRGGSLWVADTGNGRVLRFPNPFITSGSSLPEANLVIGQLNFTQTLTGVTAQTMGAPTGVAFTKDGGLVVSDARYNRVLYFQPQSGGFVNGQSATSVIGQATFASSTVNDPASGTGGLNSPRGVAVDSSDTLYVADPNNARVAMFTNLPSIGNGAPANLSLGGIYGVQGVVINPDTQEIWVANTSGNAFLRYQSYGSILQGNTSPTMNIASPGPLTLTLDAHGNPVVAEGGANRVSFYYPVMYPRHAANYFVRFAPGMLASLFPAAGAKFGDTKAQASSLPIPTTLGDVQVNVNGVASPIFYASSSQINFQVPMKTPLGLQEVQVVRVSTQEVLSDSFVSFAATAPGLFSNDGSGNNQVSAINAADNTPNSVTNPVKAGQYISLFATGQGVVPGAPSDGQVPSGTINTPSLPQVFPNLTPGTVQFSGLAPCCVGVWQINVQVPTNAAPGADPILVQYQGNNSANDGTGQHGVDSNGVQHSVTATIYVKQ